MNKLSLSIAFVLIFFSATILAGNPVKLKKATNTGTESIFETGWPLAFSPDVTFYNSQIVNGYAFSFEPSINENFSLNYRFAVNIEKKNLFSLHANPGLVVSPIMLASVIVSEDSNKVGLIFLSILALALPEGVNFKYSPYNYPQIEFAAYLNPIGVDYARKNVNEDMRLFMSGELGVKAYFAVNEMLYMGAFAGIRSIYLFNKFGYVAGVHIGLVIPRN